MVTVGAIFGGPISGWAIDKFGRKGSILLCAVPFELGWLLISNAQNRAMLYAGRVITGLACGMISLAVPVSCSRGGPTFNPQKIPCGISQPLKFPENMK